MKQDLLRLFERDLLKLKEEIGLYAGEASLWTIAPGIANSGGTLCLHLVGNLRHFIGTVLGKTAYIRQRDLEFSLRNVPREALLAGIDEAIGEVKNTLNALQDSDLDKPYPQEKNGETPTTRALLLHLLTHLGYHLGQVNYHRRLFSQTTA